jgi:hypothetical protein
MPGEAEVRLTAPETGVEVIDVGRARLGHRHAVAGEASGPQEAFQQRQRATLMRGDGGASDKRLGEGYGIAQRIEHGSSSDVRGN